jgi:hypothetical protein
MSACGWGEPPGLILSTGGKSTMRFWSVLASHGAMTTGKICRELGLSEREATSVVWIEIDSRSGDEVHGPVSRGPFVVEGGGHVFHTEAVNVSVRGAKLRVTEPLTFLGTLAWLHFHPPGEHPLDLSAVAWRVDPDGLAFFFLEDFMGAG